MDIGAKGGEKPKEAVRTCGDSGNQSRREKSENLALAPDKIASINTHDMEPIPLHQFPEVPNYGLADMAAKYRVTQLIPFPQQRKVTTAQQKINALTKVNSVGGGQNKKSSRFDNANNLPKERPR